MKNKRFLLMISCLCLVFLIVNMDKPKATGSEELLKEIVYEVKGDIQECGIKTSFIWHGDRKLEVHNILRNLQIDKSYYTNIKENEKIYLVEFNDDSIKGYVQSTSYESYKVITIDLIKKTQSYDLNELESKIIASTDNKSTTHFKYIKAKLDTNDLKSANLKVNTLLKRNGAENINTIKIDNGYSTTAYTKMFNPITISGEFADLNYALCNYYSGNYIIIGTPEILASY